MALKVAEKKQLLLAAGFEAPSRRKADPFKNDWLVPRAFLPELGSTGVDGLTTGKLMSFEEAWARYEAAQTSAP